MTTLPATRCYICLEPRLLCQMTTANIGHAAAVTVCSECIRCERIVKPL